MSGVFDGKSVLGGRKQVRNDPLFFVEHGFTVQIWLPAGAWGGSDSRGGLLAAGCTVVLKAAPDTPVDGRRAGPAGGED
jgi:hypothetical protein